MSSQTRPDEWPGPQKKPRARELRGGGVDRGGQLRYWVRCALLLYWPQVKFWHRRLKTVPQYLVTPLVRPYIYIQNRNLSLRYANRNFGQHPGPHKSFDIARPPPNVDLDSHGQFDASPVPIGYLWAVWERDRVPELQLIVQRFTFPIENWSHVVCLWIR